MFSEIYPSKQQKTNLYKINFKTVRENDFLLQHKCFRLIPPFLVVFKYVQHMTTLTDIFIFYPYLYILFISGFAYNTVKEYHRTT
jgi:hypothetical protein